MYTDPKLHINKGCDCTATNYQGRRSAEVLVLTKLAKLRQIN